MPPGLANRLLQALLIAGLVMLAIAAVGVLGAMWLLSYFPDGLLAAMASPLPASALGLFGNADARHAVGIALVTTTGLQAAVIVLLLRMLASARRGSPFTHANIARLRWVAVAYGASVLARCLLPLAMPAPVAAWLRTGNWSFNIGDLGPALAALVVAQVFAQGLALREDVEATI